MNTLKPLYIEGNEFEGIPRVCLDVQKNIFEISGVWLPEDSSEFYQPLLDWFEQYAQEPNPNSILGIKMTYIGETFSTFLVVHLMPILKKIPEMKLHIYEFLEDEEPARFASVPQVIKNDEM